MWRVKTACVCLLWTISVGFALAVPATGPAGSPRIDVKLAVPPGSRLTDTVPMMTLDMSMEANLAVVAVAPIPGPSPQPMSGTLMLADLRSGKMSPIGDLMGKDEKGKVVSARLSPDTKSLLILWMGSKGPGVYVVTLPEGKPAKVAEGFVLAEWAGAKIAMSTLTRERKVSNIRLFDPATGKEAELPVKGKVVAGLPDGTLLVAGNPKNLSGEVSAEDVGDKSRLLHIGTDGKVLADVAPMGIVSSPPAVSENGKFIAFQSKPADAPEGPGTKYGFTILSVDGKDKREFTTAWFPAAVMDDGSALVILNTSDVDGLAPLSWISKDGKTVKEIASAVTANVIAGSVVYTTNKDAPSIKTVPVPKP